MCETAAHPDRNRPLRIGLVGSGAHMAENLHPALAALPDIEIAAVSSRQTGRARTIAQRYRIPNAFDDWRDLLGSGEVDAVIAAATPEAHCEIAASALQAGLGVFVEKPPAPTLGALRRLARGETGDMQGFVGYNFRFAELVTQAVDLAQRAGPPRLMRVRFVGAKPHAPLWGLDSVASSFLLAVGIHAIDLALSAMGAPEAISVSRSDLGGGRLSMTIVLGFGDDRRAVLDLGNFGHRFESEVELVGGDGTVARVTDLRRLAWSEDAGGPGAGEQRIRELSGLKGGFKASGYAPMLSAFCASARHRTPSPVPFSASIPVYEVIEKCLSDI